MFSLWCYFFGHKIKDTECSICSKIIYKKRYIINKYSKNFDFKTYCNLEQVTRVQTFDKEVFKNKISSILSGHFTIEEDGNVVKLYSNELHYVTQEYLCLVDISYYLETFGNIIINKDTFVEYTELFIHGK